MFKIFKLNNWAIVNLSSTSISFADQNIFNKTKLPSSLFSGFELFQTEDFEKIISHLLENIKIKNSRVIISISEELTFNQSFPTSDEVTTLAQNYLDNIPLENILFSITSGKNYQLTVISQNLIENLKRIFKKNKFNVKAIIPELVLKTKKVAYNQKLDLSKKTQLAKTLSGLTSANFSDSFPKFPVDPEKSQSKPNILKNIWQKIKQFKFKELKNKLKKVNKIWLILPLVLIVLLVIFIFFKVENKPSTPTPTPTPTPTSIPTPTEIIIKPSSINLQVTFTRYSLQKTLDRIKSDFAKLGYTNINLVRDPTKTNNTKTYIIFSATASASLKEPIIKTMNNLFIDVTVQESIDLKADVINLKLGRAK